MSTFLKIILVVDLAVAAAGVCAAPATLSSPQNTGYRRVQQDTASAPMRNGDQRANLDDADAEIPEGTSTDYNCEFGNKITIYHYERDDSHIAIRWKQRIHRLDKVATTTGARRFENPTFGLIWIGIPTKGILLDSKLNRQLANECKPPQQEKDGGLARAQSATRSD
jgi:hypothetical protein